MLLNPLDYTYKYFHQSRGGEGDSGAIYLAMPKCKKEVLCPVLVKSYSVADAINEYVGCNIGQKLGIYTPCAWLFRSDIVEINNRINFSQAVGIEYLEGFDDRKISSYENEEQLVQAIKGKLLHLIMFERDSVESLGLYQGKVYAYDFAESMYPFDADRNMPIRFAYPGKHGKIILNDYELRQETEPRKAIRSYIKKLIDTGVSKELIVKIYADLRENMLKAYGENEFFDLVIEVAEVFSTFSGVFVNNLLQSIYNLLLDFPDPVGREVESYLNDDNVIIVQKT